jgi:anaerobic magnesium-protoporphyrin IX monomethyl ester cyclase
MAKILFVNPVVREEDVPRHIPYGIALLAAIAIKNGHLVQVYDANAWRKGFNILPEVYKADDWDVIAIGGLTTTYNFIKEAFRIAKESAPDAFLIAGGGFLTSMPQEIMEWVPQIDLGIVGEAFVTWPEVLKKIDNQDLDFSKTLGVIRRTADLTPVLNATRPIIHDLDSLPAPAWELFPLEEVYFHNSSSLFSEDAYRIKRRIDINASFGCSLVCRYCWHLGTTGDMLIEKNDAGDNDVVFTYGRNIRFHSPDYVVGMVKDLKQKYNIDFVNFLDENLMTMDASSKRTWMKEICEKWIAAGLQPSSRRPGGKAAPPGEEPGVFWSGTSHASLHTPEILKLMYEAGCTHLVYGLESFDPRVLKNLGKGTTRQKNIDSVGECMKSGIIPLPNIIIGFPEEDFESIRNTVTALIKLGIHARPHFATAYPGSEWYYTYKESIRAQYDGNLENYVKDLGDATKITAIISHNFTGLELLGLQEIVAQRNLRILDQAEKHWGRTERPQIAEPKSSFNFKRKKIDGPMEPATSEK